MIRGLRDGTDLDYEMQMAGMNADHGAGTADGFPAGQPFASRTITATLGSSDSLDGRRHQPLRSRGGRRAAEAPNSRNSPGSTDHAAQEARFVLRRSRRPAGRFGRGLRRRTREHDDHHAEGWRRDGRRCAPTSRRSMSRRSRSWCAKAPMTTSPSTASSTASWPRPATSSTAT